MSDCFQIRSELGPDADLLIMSDRWLDERRKSIAQQVTELVDDLRVIMAAQRIKCSLQQTNLVAVKHEQQHGLFVDNVIRILPLRAAIPFGDKAQHNVWQQDGYDMPLAAG